MLDTEERKRLIGIKKINVIRFHIMNEQEILKRLEAAEEKLEKIWQSVEKTRKYFLWILTITIVAIILPAIGLVFAVPKFISLYSNIFSF